MKTTHSFWMDCLPVLVNICSRKSFQVVLITFVHMAAVTYHLTKKSRTQQVDLSPLLIIFKPLVPIKKSQVKDKNFKK